MLSPALSKHALRGNLHLQLLTSGLRMVAMFKVCMRGCMTLMEDDAVAIRTGKME